MDFTSYINPELLALVPVLYFIGYALKRSKLPSKHIPLMLMAGGIIIAAVWGLSQYSNTVAGTIFTSIVQGVLCAGAAVFVNQLIKQGGKKE